MRAPVTDARRENEYEGGSGRENAVSANSTAIETISDGVEMYDEERLADLRHDCEGDEYVGHVCARCDWGSGFSPASRWGMCERDYSMCDAYGTCPEWENWEEEHEQAYESR